jgi:predicted membrane protein
VLQYATAAILGLAPGVNVMITIFSDFHPFYANMGDFLGTQCYGSIPAVYIDM